MSQGIKLGKSTAVTGALVVVIALIARTCGIDQQLIEQLTGDKDTTVVQDNTVPTTQEQQQVEPQTQKEDTNVGKLTAFQPTFNLGKLMDYKYFSLSYVESHKQPEWVAYELKKSDLDKDDFPRPPTFKPDPRLPKDEAVQQSDYSRSGYDRGHLAPAADFSWNKEGLGETFYTTNISPQEPDFNRGIWKKLEGDIRDWATQFGHLYVVTGGILTERAKKRFPKNKQYVAVPRRYYKVLLNYNADKPFAIGFILENEKSKEPLGTFAVSVDEVEKVTGIDFFAALPDGIEKSVESTFDLADWNLESDN